MSWLIFLALLLPVSQDPQFPPIGIIDLYGLRNISERQVREALQIKSSYALLALTDKRDPVILSELRQKALPSLVEMARWKSSGHANAPFFLLGRVAGLPEDEITAAWERDDRLSFIETAVKRSKAK